MARPSRLDEQRKELLPIVAKTFADLGYRRTTTAELAKRCDVRENILYRLWIDKRAMFVAAIELVYAHSAETWQRLLAEGGNDDPPAVRLLKYEAEHHGESGLQRLIFAGLSEANDPIIRRALRDMYRRFHEFTSQQVSEYRNGARQTGLDVGLSAWGIVGLGSLSSIAQELRMLNAGQRQQIMATVGQLLINGRIAT